MDKIIKKIKKHCVYFSENEDMSRHTTIRCGGIARFFCQVASIRKMAKIIKIAKKHMKIFILGNGSNTVFLNFNGLVICTKKLDYCKIKKQKVYCQCGVNLFRLNLMLRQNGLSGLEFSFGIPATVGGACAMNAGAFGGQFSDVVDKVLVFDKKIKILKKKKLGFGYRTSSIKQKNMTVLAVWFKLKKQDGQQIENLMQQYYQRRKDTQPQLPSAGSVFKRNGDVVVSKVIDELGLKGTKINGAMISEKHAGFIVNYNNASPYDVVRLVDFIKQEVKNKRQIDLKEEIEITGE